MAEGRTATDASTWTQLQIDQLSAFYEAYPAPAVLPMTDMVRILGRPQRQITRKAQALGLTSGKRGTTERTLLDTECPICGTVYRPKLHSQKYCSMGCAQRDYLATKGHPRGMAGKQHSDDTKQRLRETSGQVMAALTPEEMAERLAPMRSGHMKRLAAGQLPTHTRARGGRRADLGDQYFRSSWEANYARYLNLLVSLNEIKGWEFECRTFEFPVKRGNRFYTPDFLVHSHSRDEWHEVKGWMDAKSKTKLARFARHYPDEVLVLIDEPVYRSIAATAGPLIKGWE